MMGENSENINFGRIVWLPITKRFSDVVEIGKFKWQTITRERTATDAIRLPFHYWNEFAVAESIMLSDVGCRWLALLFIIRGRKTFFVNSFLLRDESVRGGRQRVRRIFTSISEINVNNNSGLHSSYVGAHSPIHIVIILRRRSHCRRCTRRAHNEVC